MSQRTPYGGGQGGGSGGDLPRRPADFLAPLARRVDQKPMSGHGLGKADERRLTVARDITITGQIKGCGRLTVEGQVDADLSDCRHLEIAEGGVFRGKALVESADVRGHVDGDLTVAGRLLIRASGRVSGVVRYLDVQIEPGGRLSGQIETLEPPPAEPAPFGSQPIPRITLAASKPVTDNRQAPLELTEEAQGLDHNKD